MFSFFKISYFSQKKETLTISATILGTHLAECSCTSFADLCIAAEKTSSLQESRIYK